MNLLYRRIEESDIDAIFDVRIKTWHNENGAEELRSFGITPESVRRYLCSTHRGWLCQVDSKVVGFAMGDKSNGEMWVIAVLKEFEGQGIGKQLLNKVENWLFGEGWDEIWLTTDVDETLRAVGFYRNLGWKDWKFEMGDRFMKKDIQ